MFWPLLLRFRKPLGIAIAILGLCGLIWWQLHAYGERQYKAGQAQVQALWDADTAARDKVTQEAMAAAEKRLQDALANNAEVMTDANAKLLAIAADRESLAGRLRNYENSLRRITAGQATSQLGADVGAGIAARTAAVDAAYDAYDRSCQRDAVRFQALQDEIRPQL